MYYINFIFLYSFLGFTLESFYFKYCNAQIHSGIFKGPYTLVYGFGMLASFIIYNNLSLILNNNIISYFLYYIIFILITTIIEFIGGHIIHLFLNIDKWDYSNNKYHFGKYICLKNSLIWGILVFIIIFYIHPYLNNNILLTIPNYSTYTILFVFLIDLIQLIIKRSLNNRLN